MKIRTILATLLLAALPFSVLDAQEIRSVNTEVVLNVDGSADITQIWDATVVSGTEWYIPVTNLGKMKVSDLHVFENGQEYVNEGRRWDVDRSIERKAGKCGIVEKGGNDVEICWGQGSYGDHIWTCKYHLSGLVQALRTMTPSTTSSSIQDWSQCLRAPAWWSSTTPVRSSGPARIPVYGASVSTETSTCLPEVWSQNLTEGSRA